jgi:hypothetical protein
MSILAFALPILLAGGHPGATERSAPAPREAACEGPDVDPWITEFRDRVLAYDGLARFAVGRYGSPIACEGTVTGEFDGANYGTLRLSFSGGVNLEVQSMPPEISITTLGAPAGFDDEAAVRQALEAHVRDIGLAIDWSEPELGTDGASVVHTFWDEDPGLNASASLVFENDRLVAVRVSMAL